MFKKILIWMCLWVICTMYVKGECHVQTDEVTFRGCMGGVSPFCVSDLTKIKFSNSPSKLNFFT